MGDERERSMIIATAVKRGGKSNETLRRMYLKAYHAQFKSKGLIFDINSEYGEIKVYEPDGSYNVRQIKRIGWKDIPYYSSHPTMEVRRLVPLHDNGEPMEEEEIDAALIQVLKEFRGGTLLIEDMSSVIGDSLPKQVSGAFCNNAHRDCDIVLHLQSIGRILPKMRQNTNFVRFHKQNDSVDDSKTKLKDEYEIFKIAEILVNTEFDNGNKRFFVWIDRDYMVLRGQFSRSKLKDAIEKYLSLNRKPVNLLVKMKDRKGRDIYTHESAFDKAKQDLFKKYNGNDAK